MRAVIWTRRILTGVLTMVAFANSYAHTVDWFKDHGQAGQAGWLAAIPEVGVILVVLTLVSGKLSKAEQYIVGSIGAGSLAITFTANLAGASAGPMGVSAALVAPAFAVLGFALEALAVAGKRPVKKVAQKAQKPAVASKKVSTAGRQSLTDIGILWATEVSSNGAPWPTRKQIQEKFPEISSTTAGRIHKAEPVKVNQ